MRQGDLRVIVGADREAPPGRQCDGHRTYTLLADQQVELTYPDGTTATSEYRTSPDRFVLIAPASRCSYESRSGQIYH